MSLNFWELIYHFFDDDNDKDMVEYEFENGTDFKCMITAHKESEDVLILNVLDPEQWEMVQSIVELTEGQVSDVIRSLSDDEVDQIRLDLSHWDLEGD